MPVIPVFFALWIMSGRVRRVIVGGLKNPETRGLIYATLIVLAAGTVFYRLVEGWGWVDSLYFAVVTLTTVGYGDLAPQTAPGKIFTIFYILAGLGILGSFIAFTAEHMRQTPGIFQPGGTPEQTSSTERAEQ